jgi:hypothetical protein
MQFVDQIGNEAGPPGLVRGADAATVVAVEIFMEPDKVLN